MKKLITAVVVAAGLATAQTPYVGAYAGLFNGPRASLFLGGFHAGITLQEGLEVRGGVNFISFLFLFIPGFSVDFLLNLKLPESRILPYGGLGGNIWLYPQPPITVYGVHATLGVKYPISGAPVMAFLEAQPTYVFSSGHGQFVYNLKIGANRGL